jgi:hypothetical protein
MYSTGVYNNYNVNDKYSAMHSYNQIHNRSSDSFYGDENDPMVSNQNDYITPQTKKTKSKLSATQVTPATSRSSQKSGTKAPPTTCHRCRHAPGNAQCNINVDID